MKAPTVAKKRTRISPLSIVLVRTNIGPIPAPFPWPTTAVSHRLVEQIVAVSYDLALLITALEVKNSTNTRAIAPAATSCV
jgi:hypothetical protein